MTAGLAAADFEERATPPASPRSSSSPVYGGSFNDSTRTLVLALERHAAEARALGATERAVRFERLARRLTACAEASARHSGWRCGHPACPRCEGRKAVRLRLRLESRMRRPGILLALVTASIATDDLRSGAKALARHFAALRRRQMWRQVFAGGEQHLEAKPARPGGVRAWNVHLHAVVERLPGAGLDCEQLAAGWLELLSREGLAGSFQAKPIRRHFAIYREG